MSLCSQKTVVILVLIILGAVLSSACSGGPSNHTTVSLALDWFPNSNHSGFYMAQEMGYYEDEQLDVNIFVPANPEDVLKTVGSGRDDFGISYQAEVLLARGEGVPVKSIAAIVQHPLNSVMVLQNSGITRPSHLSGKKIAVTGIPSEEALFSTMLEHDGISLEDVTLVNVGFELSPALIGGKVDAIVGAYWTYESIVMEMQGFPVDVLRMEEWGVPDFYELVLVANQDMIARNPELVRAFLRATAKGFADAMNDHQGAVDILVDANPEADKSLEIQSIGLLAPMWTHEAPIFGWQTEERWTSLARWMKGEGLLHGDIDGEQAFTSEFVTK